MPVEIKELVIRTVVSDKNNDGAGEDTGESVSPGVTSNSAVSDVVVQECVRQVMRILARKKER